MPRDADRKLVSEIFDGLSKRKIRDSPGPELDNISISLLCVKY